MTQIYSQHAQPIPHINQRMILQSNVIPKTPEEKIPEEKIPEETTDVPAEDGTGSKEDTKVGKDKTRVFGYEIEYYNTMTVKEMQPPHLRDQPQSWYRVRLLRGYFFVLQLEVIGIE